MFLSSLFYEWMDWVCKQGFLASYWFLGVRGVETEQQNKHHWGAMPVHAEGTEGRGL